MKQTRRNHQRFSWLKVLIASLSITSIFGLYNFLLNPTNKDLKEGNNKNYKDVKDIVNQPIPTLVPMNEDVQIADTLEKRGVESIESQPTTESPTPEIEVVIVGSSSGGSGNTTTTASSR